LLIFFSPLMLVAAAAIRLESPGPALFRQRRRGFNNVEIWVYKFRTMWAHAEDPSGSRQTELNDPRVTRVGRLLRASSLDELPQLLNVLRGDMSLVGPRPHPIGMRVGGVLCEDAILAYPHRHRVKPGITGLAQIEGSRGPAVELSALSQRLAYDFDYIAAASIWLDLKILALTPLRLMTSKAF
jgi:lipopolysaccharide/colanic/teichoic acid biosynthesis glycosyltransferase